jgi:hypothetical protein
MLSFVDMQPQPSPPSNTVHIANRLVTAAFWFVIGFGVVILVSIALGLARHGDSLLYGDKLGIPIQLSPADVGRLPRGFNVESPVDASYTLNDPTTKEMLLRSAQDLAPIALMLAILWQLRGFARSVVGGDPFGAANVGRLRRIGFLVVLGVPLVDILNAPLRAALSDAVPSPPGIDVSVHGFTLSLNTLLVGLAAFVLAEVFAYGSALREDVEATV